MTDDAIPSTATDEETKAPAPPEPKPKPASKPKAEPKPKPKDERPTCEGCGAKHVDLTEQVTVGTQVLAFHGCEQARAMFTGWFRSLTRYPDAAPPAFTS